MGWAGWAGFRLTARRAVHPRLQSVLYYMLPTERDQSVINRLRFADKMPRTFAKANKFNYSRFLLNYFAVSMTSCAASGMQYQWSDLDLINVNRPRPRPVATQAAGPSAIGRGAVKCYKVAAASAAAATCRGSRIQRQQWSLSPNFVFRGKR